MMQINMQSSSEELMKVALEGYIQWLKRMAPGGEYNNYTLDNFLVDDPARDLFGHSTVIFDVKPSSGYFLRVIGVEAYDGDDGPTATLIACFEDDWESKGLMLHTLTQTFDCDTRVLISNLEVQTWET